MGADHGLTLAFKLAFHYLRSRFYRVTAADRLSTDQPLNFALASATYFM
jgi:hypothetical protein